MKSPKYVVSLQKLFIIALVILSAVFFVSSCTDKEAKRQAKKEEHYKNGIELLKGGKFEEAVIEFKNAIKQDPNFANAYYQLGLVQLEQEQYNQG